MDDKNNIYYLLLIALGGGIIYRNKLLNYNEDDEYEEDKNIIPFGPINQHGPFISDEEYFKIKVDDNEYKKIKSFLKSFGALTLSSISSLLLIKLVRTSVYISDLLYVYFKNNKNAVEVVKKHNRIEKLLKSFDKKIDELKKQNKKIKDENPFLQKIKFDRGEVKPLEFNTGEFFYKIGLMPKFEQEEEIYENVITTDEIILDDDEEKIYNYIILDEKQETALDRVANENNIIIPKIVNTQSKIKTLEQILSKYEETISSISNNISFNLEDLFKISSKYNNIDDISDDNFIKNFVDEVIKVGLNKYSSLEKEKIEKFRILLEEYTKKLLTSIKNILFFDDDYGTYLDSLNIFFNSIFQKLVVPNRVGAKGKIIQGYETIVRDTISSNIDRFIRSFKVNKGLENIKKLFKVFITDEYNNKLIFLIQKIKKQSLENIEILFNIISKIDTEKIKTFIIFRITQNKKLYIDYNEIDNIDYLISLFNSSEELKSDYLLNFAFSKLQLVTLIELIRSQEGEEKIKKVFDVVVKFINLICDVTINSLNSDISIDKVEKMIEIIKEDFKKYEIIIKTFLNINSSL